jgi:murein DD-endopeptidase MepM/ murein hydrolase activator NlpD
MSKRYTFILADRSSGKVRRATVGVRPFIVAVATLLALPILIGCWLVWTTELSVADLRTRHSVLELENQNYREATDALASQIQSLQDAITDLSARSALEPSLAEAMDNLPSLIRAQAMGGDTSDAILAPSLVDGQAPTEAFGVLSVLLDGLESRLLVVRDAVEQRNALAAATPSIWPAYGWLSSRLGWRRDPITGGDDYHSGLDIAAERGQPVYATAAGTVVQAGRQGNYGNLITLDHGFNIRTRYGHLLDFAVDPGTQVQRGDVIGHVGATGRATGYHLHYEVMANGALLNPLQLLTEQPLTR